MKARTKAKMKKQLNMAIASILAGTLVLPIALPAQAGDPFREQNPSNIGDQTEQAFELMFKDGNFVAAKETVDRAFATEADEPLLHAMKASLFYINKDNANDLEAMRDYALKTRQAAQALMAENPLRGHLYTGASYLLEAGYEVTKKGVVRGAAKGLSLVQEALDEIELAAEINPDDPEVNLIQGYMDMLVASVVPLADLEEALGSLRKSGPEYLKWRGIALGYRDAKMPNEALEAVDKALAYAPENPEIVYLKGQILWMKRDYQKGLSDSEKNKLSQGCRILFPASTYQKKSDGSGSSRRDCRTMQGLN
jgi:tetratricopeptide (TPR) repeat protein